jgi:hypothetical protein
MNDDEARVEKQADEIRLRLQDIGRIIKRELPAGWAFTMLVANQGGVHGVTLYISTIDRGDSLQLMREFIATQREERNWAQEMPDVETPEEFEAWWKHQQGRRSGKQQPLKKWCEDAYMAGRSSA